MRLTRHQIEIIKTQVADIFGPDVSVHLFGSRLDDARKGGDIDLLIVSNRAIDKKIEKSSRLAARLQMTLGDQKFDIVVKDTKTPDTPFYREAARKAIPL